MGDYHVRFCERLEAKASGLLDFLGPVPVKIGRASKKKSKMMREGSPHKSTAKANKKSKADLSVNRSSLERTRVPQCGRRISGSRH